jgi:hypothetical protein
MVRIGFTPMAMLWKPEKDAAMKWDPPAEWRAFQRRWVRPAIIHESEVSSCRRSRNRYRRRRIAVLSMKRIAGYKGVTGAV